MELNTRIFEVFADEADRSVIGEIHIGLGYTAVLLQDGRCGICATLCDRSHALMVNKDSNDYEGRSALQLLRHVRGEDAHLSRVMAIALVNALNQPFANSLPETPQDWHRDLGLPEDASIAMVGHFSPVFERFEETGFTVKTLDLGWDMGNPEEFYPWATSEADALVITGTSLVNNTLESILDRFRGKDIPILLLGPSTVLHPEVYTDLPIRYIAGSVVIVTKDILKAVRNGRGSLDVHHQAKKVYLPLG
ncbi:MAG TPA: DUF364 domain-containing protein [Sphaerochaetaceae bacterium]|jgi:hypothetical protein|nr:DUF364 domain-containing protein [Sphaerochaetaceae bacterium]